MSRPPNAMTGHLQIPYLAMEVQSTHKIWDPNLTKHSPFGRVDARLSERH